MALASLLLQPSRSISFVGLNVLLIMQASPEGPAPMSIEASAGLGVGVPPSLTANAPVMALEHPLTLCMAIAVPLMVAPFVQLSRQLMLQCSAVLFNAIAMLPAVKAVGRLVLIWLMASPVGMAMAVLSTLAALMVPCRWTLEVDTNPLPLELVQARMVPSCMRPAAIGRPNLVSP